MYTLKDVNGKFFTIEDYELYSQLQGQGFKIFGFDIPTILAMRKQYLLRFGPLDSSPETVKKTFGA